MKQKIEDLWNGTIFPSENCGVGDPEIKNVVMLIERHKELLDNQLPKQHKVTFEKYVDCAEEYTYLITMRAFVDGFCLAAKLMTEVFYEDS